MILYAAQARYAFADALDIRRARVMVYVARFGCHFSSLRRHAATA